MPALCFICYPKCSTCKKARAWLDEHHVEYSERDISIDNPSKEELKEWHKTSGLPIRRLFNTSGMLYREQNVKAKLDAGLSDEEGYKLLASSGMMVKRPVLVGDGFVLFGFKQDEWGAKLLS